MLILIDNELVDEKKIIFNPTNPFQACQNHELALEGARKGGYVLFFLLIFDFVFVFVLFVVFIFLSLILIFLLFLLILIILLSLPSPLPRMVLVNIGANDLHEGNINLCLGVVAQCVRCLVLSKVNVRRHPSLLGLVDEAEGEGNLYI